MACLLASKKSPQDGPQGPRDSDFSATHPPDLHWALFTEWVLAPEFTESYRASLEASGKHGPLLESGWLLRGRQAVTGFPWPSKAKDKQISRKQKLSGYKLGAPKFLGDTASTTEPVCAWPGIITGQDCLDFLYSGGDFKRELFTRVSLKLLFKKFLIWLIYAFTS